jgi:hypothetical protein
LYKILQGRARGAASDHDLLVRALLLFEGGKNLAAYLTDRRSQKQADLAPFEAGVVWLFSLLGLRCVPLLIYRKGEQVREEKSVVGSADILASDPQLGLGLMVIDCTRAVPDNPKTDELRNTALFLSEQLGHPVHAVIVTPTDLIALPQESARYGVAFLDRHQIGELWDLIEHGNTTLARGRFVKWIRDVPEIGEA